MSTDSHLPSVPEPGVRELPIEVRASNRPLQFVLAELADALRDVAGRMPEISGIVCSMNVDPEQGKASLYFKASR